MFRVLVLMLLAYLVFRGIESLLRQTRAVPRGRARPIRPSAPAGSAGAAETLVRCAGCGVHVPRSRTLTAAGGAFFCSEDCRRHAAQSA